MQSQAPNDLLSFITYFNPDYIINWHHKAICDRLTKLKDEVGKKLMIFVGPQRGKMFWDKTPVMTLNGYVDHGDLKVGDYVYNPNGEPIKVLAVGEKIECNMMVEFNEEWRVYTHADHEWALSRYDGKEDFKVESKWFLSPNKYRRPNITNRYLKANGGLYWAYYVTRKSKIGEYKHKTNQGNYRKDLRDVKIPVTNARTLLPHELGRVGNCIQVEGGMYCVGKHAIPTHNSEIVSRNFPAWWLGNFNGSKNIMSSYSADLANSFNRDAQQIMLEPDYKKIFPDLKTAKDEGYGYLKMAQNEIQTGSDGYLFSTGVGGSTTGRAAGAIGSNRPNLQKGLFICDDPIKDLADAFSEAGQLKRWEWWQAVVNTRVHRTSHTILMHTRWAQNDIAGTLLADDAVEKGWEVLSFPELGPDLEYPNEYDPRTEENEPLWPEEKGDYEDLMKIKETVGSYTWSALFQQKPVVQGGNIIKEDWINYYTKLPFDPINLRTFDMCQSWDLTFKETRKGSFVVGVTIGRFEANYYILDIYRKRANIMETMRAIRTMSQTWPNCNKILVEEKANGSAILDLLKDSVSGMVSVLPDATKDERLMSVAPLFEAGNIYIPANHPMTKEIVNELTTFPTCPHDDIVDAISQGLNQFSKLRGLARLKASVM